MAKRLTSTTRVKSDEVQGKGSWVLVVNLTVDEVRALRKEAGDADADTFELGVGAIAGHIKDWNWVDEEEKPLPNPEDDPGVIGRLTMGETDFLSDILLYGDRAERKN
jgi:hypothetical protein